VGIVILEIAPSARHQEALSCLDLGVLAKAIHTLWLAACTREPLGVAQGMAE